MKCRNGLYVYRDYTVLAFEVTADGPIRSGRTECRDPASHLKLS